MNNAIDSRPLLKASSEKELGAVNQYIMTLHAECDWLDICVYMYIYIYIHTYIHTYIQYKLLLLVVVVLYMYICMESICIHVWRERERYSYRYVYTRICIHTCALLYIATLHTECDWLVNIFRMCISTLKWKTRGLLFQCWNKKQVLFLFVQRWTSKWQIVKYMLCRMLFERWINAPQHFAGSSSTTTCARRPGRARSTRSARPRRRSQNIADRIKYRISFVKSSIKGFVIISYKVRKRFRTNFV